MLGSVTIGGCVDAQVIEHAEAVLVHQTPRLLELPLGDEEAWEIGLSCAGILEVFIEPLDTEHLQPYSLYATLKSHVDQGGAGTLLTCLDGATTGAKLLLLDNGTRLGTLGSLGPDQAAIDMAHAQITQGTSRTVRFPLPQASVRVFVEVHSPLGRKAVARDLAGRAQNDAPPASGQVCPPASPGCPGGDRRLSHPGQDDCLLTSFALWTTLYRGKYLDIYFAALRGSALGLPQHHAAQDMR